MKNTKRLYPPRAVAVAQRPVSDATDFYDTDFELSDSEDEDKSPRMSLDSVCLLIFPMSCIASLTETVWL